VPHRFTRQIHRSENGIFGTAPGTAYGSGNIWLDGSAANRFTDPHRPDASVETGLLLRPIFDDYLKRGDCRPTLLREETVSCLQANDDGTVCCTRLTAKRQRKRELAQQLASGQ